ncbi:hypothetical protein EDB84DRAFT_1405364 [Lactarius hengduanensis]|nr:hypothetical protein EDB84DRAFT_1405364 [Lactarius hengduanensis]
MAAILPPPPPPPRIHVYSKLPCSVAPAGPQIRRTNWHWIHCLTFTLEQLNQLPGNLHQWPYKWIRFAIGVVVGAEGELSTTLDAHNVVDYNAVPPAESATLYYHVSNQERERLFPVDPDALRTSITSGAPSTRRQRFRDDVAARDGGRCVLTMWDETYCDAVHLLAHSKGDSYITNHTQRRSQVEDDVITSIDSIRNGLFLNTMAHRLLGRDLAFIKTPNFAMNTTDIDPDAPPDQWRCTTHLFRPFPMDAATSGTILQVLNTNRFPPAVLFDIVYGGVMLHQFGTPNLQGRLANNWEDAFYQGGATTTRNAEYRAILGTRATAEETKQIHDRERDERWQARQHLDMATILPFIMVPPNELQALIREVREKAELAEKRRVCEKVEEWIGQLEADTWMVVA